MKNKVREEAKNEECLTILKKLSDGQPSYRVDFEYSEGGRIPHSSLVDRWNDLLKSNKIKQVRTSEKSKKGLPLKSGKITLIGFLELFRLANKKDYNEIKPFLKNFLPIVDLELENLMNVFTTEQIFESISSVCKNTIVIKKNNLRDIQSDTERLHLVPGSLVSSDVKWVHLYDIEIRVGDDTEQIISKKIFLGGQKKNERSIILEDVKAERVIREMLTFAVFYQFILNIRNVDYNLKVRYMDLATTGMLQLIESNKHLNRIFLKHLQYVENQQIQKLNQITKLKKSITKKIPYYKVKI